MSHDLKAPLILLLGAALLFAGGAAAQEKDPVIRSEVNQIFVPVSVSSLDGKPITGLERKDFQLLEDDMPQDILNFAREETPLNVVFLMDISHSTFMELGAIKKAIRAFVTELQDQDRVAIVTFNNEARLILDWSNDLIRLDRALDRVVPKGNTVWYDALYVTYNELLPHVSGKKVIISVTDGWDTASLVSFHEILEKLTASDTQLYVVSKVTSIRDYLEYYRREYGYRYDETVLAKIMYSSEAQLQKLTRDSGGRVLPPQSADNLTQTYQNLVKELRMQYFLSYTPHNVLRDGSYRKIAVRVLRPGARVACRPGYYAR